MLEYLEQQKKLTINQWKIFAAVTIGCGDGLLMFLTEMNFWMALRST